MENLTKLNTLTFNGNQIKAIAGLETLTNLQTLEIVNNQIKAIAGLETLINLQILDIEHNQISLKNLKNIRSRSEYSFAQQCVAYCRIQPKSV
ncbi:MAG: leucine-rich repeat domain-containing protein [Promethearchaeota archaeon]